MAQCISRYQINLPRYANRFIWLKKRRYAEWCAEAAVPTDRSGRYIVSEDEAAPFYDWLYAEQLIWASKTAWSNSPIPEGVREAGWLKTLLRAVDDIAFVLYRPVVMAGTASVQLDSMLITSDQVWCLYPLSGEKGSVFQEQSRRTWREIRSETDRQMINPEVSLARTKSVVSSLLAKKGIAMGVAAAVFTTDGYIEFVHTAADTRFIDRRTCRDWFRRLSIQSTMFKKDQIEAASLLLSLCETGSGLRDEDVKGTLSKS